MTLPRNRTLGALAACALVLALALAAAASASGSRTLLVLGDSLGAAYGLRPEQGWVALLAKRLAARDPAWRVVNASVSGETTRGGVERLPGLLASERPEVVMIELGGNDGLRGLALDHTRANLARMAREAQAAGARVLLIGMRMPPNYGPLYTERFESMYREVAETQGTALVPFLLEGIGTRLDLMQPDGIHPRAEAEPRLVENVWPYLEPLL